MVNQDSFGFTLLMLPTYSNGNIRTFDLEPTNVIDTAISENNAQQRQKNCPSIVRGTPKIRRPSVIQYVGSNVHSGNYCDGYKAPIPKQSLPKVRKTVISNKPRASGSLLISENKEKKFICQFCGKSFQWFSHWQAHKRTHTGERPFKCESCDKCFTRSDGLKCHQLTHKKKKTNLSRIPQNQENTKQAQKECGITRKCGDTFEPAKIKDQVTGVFKCYLCGRNYSSSAGLVKHMQGHKGKKELKCDSCAMTFSKQSALNVHCRVHTGEKPYCCNVCNKTFSICGNLKRHLLIHTGERPYICSKCFRSFNNPSHLTRHLKRKH